ncbi:MAG TPA: hypothetical protein VGY54_12170, partial [Polyangiaceae bacterium]|nr:hypothetical protein [Polyangiaceae bacterium]
MSIEDPTTPLGYSAPISVELDQGMAIRGVFPDRDVCAMIREASGGDLPLVIADPPYGNILAASWDDAGDDDSKF